MAQARAHLHSIQGSPRKMRLVLDLVRGKRVKEALNILHFLPNHASVEAEKTLRSAIANFQLKPEHGRFDIEELYVVECYSDGGPMLRRVLPAPQGRAFRMRKRSNHLTFVISDKAPTPKKGHAASKLRNTKKLALKNEGGAAAEVPATKSGTKTNSTTTA